MDILILVGSLRETRGPSTWPRRWWTAAEGRERARVRRTRRLPHYDQDLDTDQPPDPVVAFREAVAAPTHWWS